MSNQFTTMIKEVAPGKGTLDYSVFLREVENLDPRNAGSYRALGNP